MVDLVGTLPFVAVIAIVIVTIAFLGDVLDLLGPVEIDLDAWLTEISRRYFGRYVPEDAPERRRTLRAAYVDETYRSYAAKSYTIALLAGLAGGVVGVYLTGGVLLVLPIVGEFIDQLPDAMANALGRPELDPVLGPQQVLLVLVAGGAAIGTVVSGVVYYLRWELRRNDAEIRRRSINEGLPRTIAFVYALSRGGMEIPKVLRTLAHNRSVYGDGADEISVAVREMDLFGSDIITAIRRMSERTPSYRFKTFSENLASVLQSGQNLPEFLRNQYDRHQQKATDRQTEILELLSTIAEAYVTVFVAGVLFLMTILMVFGLTTSPTLNFLRVIAYVLIPIGNLVFIIYLGQKLDLLGISRGTDVEVLRETLRERHSMPETGVGVTDGGHAESDVKAHRAQLGRYDSIRTLRRAIGNPVSTVLSSPTRILYVTVPIAVLFVAVRTPSAFNEVGFNVRAFDDILLQASLFVVATFAVVWELYSRRIARIEAALPELLDRLASLNEAGMSVIESIDNVREGDLGVLSGEVERIWRDIRYGANVDVALARFGLRVRTTSTTRVVTLLTNALTASGSLGPVLGIAAQQAHADIRLRRQRRQQMLTYLIVIYLAFLVFLVIILAVHEVLVPSIPNNVPTPTGEQTSRLGVDVTQFSRFGRVNKAAYTLVFFHTALIQAFTSGLIAGQFGEGSLKDGAKHAAIMLAVAYVAFLLISTPSAQLSFESQSVDDGAVVVDSVSLTEGGFVVVRTAPDEGRIVGQSEYLAAGTHEDVRIPLDSSLGTDGTLYAVPHLDTDGNERFDFTGDPDGVDRIYPSETQIADPARVEPERSTTSVTRPGSLAPGGWPTAATAHSDPTEYGPRQRRVGSL